MTIEQLINARESVSVLYQAKVDGRTALKIRRAVRSMNEPLKDYDEALRAWIESEGVEGKMLSDLSKDQQRHWMEMMQAEVDHDWEAPVGVEDLAGVELSAAQIDRLIDAGLIRDEDEPSEDEPNTKTPSKKRTTKAAKTEAA